MQAPESRFRTWVASLFADTSGSQMLEFAVALPLLVVFVVGIFDFGEAFNTKLKLSNITREGARFGSALPTNDLDTAGSLSVQAIRDLVETSLQAAKLKDCGGLTGATVAADVFNQTWTYTATGGGCPAPGLMLTIERSYSFQSTIDGNTFDVLSTRITLKYPYQWRLFNRVIGLLAPGAAYPGVSPITTDAVVPNME